MSEILRVPRLGLTFNLSNVAFKIGAVNVYWYGILITLGFILGMIYIASMAKKFDVDVTKVVDIIVYSIFGGILGARAYYVIFNFDVYKNNLIDVFKIWEGGLAIHGGIIAALLTIIIYTKKYCHINIFDNKGKTKLTIGEKYEKFTKNSHSLFVDYFTYSFCKL